jgi:tetratricopeptide (TPR) repeat protein
LISCGIQVKIERYGNYFIDGEFKKSTLVDFELRWFCGSPAILVLGVSHERPTVLSDNCPWLQTHYLSWVQNEAAIALQKAIEYKPNDTQLRFDAARSFGDSNFNALALMNYQTLLRFEPDNAGALNNIGIVYGAMKMPARQSDSYKKAFEKGLTIAAANLAYEYMNAGFMDEATEILNKAKEKEDVHPNVGNALAAAANKKQEESTMEQEALEAAREQRQFVLSFAQAYFSEPSTNPQYEGSWHFPDGVEAAIRRKDSELEITWERNDEAVIMTLRTQNRGALVTKYSRKERFLPTSLGDKGYAYLSEDDQHMSIMVLDDNRHFFLTLKRDQQ